jgi:hypothetical protein
MIDEHRALADRVGRLDPCSLTATMPAEPIDRPRADQNDQSAVLFDLLIRGLRALGGAGLPEPASTLAGSGVVTPARRGSSWYPS